MVLLSSSYPRLCQAQQGHKQHQANPATKSEVPTALKTVTGALPPHPGPRRNPAGCFQECREGVWLRYLANISISSHRSQDCLYRLGKRDPPALFKQGTLRGSGILTRLQEMLQTEADPSPRGPRASIAGQSSLQSAWLTDLPPPVAALPARRHSPWKRSLFRCKPRRASSMGFRPRTSRHSAPTFSPPHPWAGCLLVGL